MGLECLPAPHRSNEFFTHRFLLARNNEADKAEQMLAEHKEWRSQNMPILKSSCLNEFMKGKLYLRGYLSIISPFNLILMYYTNIGLDNEGHPLLIWRASLHEAADRDMSEMIRLITWWFQYIDANMPEHKSKVTLLCDRSDYRSSNSDIELIKAASNVLQV